MLVLTTRTDKPEAEIGLYQDSRQLAYVTWQAHRQLAETIHLKVEELLRTQAKTLDDLDGLVAFKGPGSFTGLRIGLSVANALAYSLGIPIVTAATENWITQGIQALQAGTDEKIGLPEYGATANVTLPRK